MRIFSNFVRGSWTGVLTDTQIRWYEGIRNRRTIRKHIFTNHVRSVAAECDSPYRKHKNIRIFYPESSNLELQVLWLANILKEERRGSWSACARRNAYAGGEGYGV